MRGSGRRSELREVNILAVFLRFVGAATPFTLEIRARREGADGLSDELSLHEGT
jgi:hypothetical protein